jgi:hypothetical protein
MKRTKVDMEIFTMNLCAKLGHEHCPGISVLYAGKQKLGPVAYICDCHKAKSRQRFHS